MADKNLIRSNFLRRHSVLLYFFLAFIISWGFVLLLAGPANIPIDPETSGDVLPLLYVSMLLGPSVGGLLLTGLLDRKEGYRQLFARLFKWRVSVRWYAVALLLAPVSAILILYALSFYSADFYLAIFVEEDWTALLMSGLLSGIMVGIFEELGWSGFAIPRLWKRHSILTTGVLVGLVWGAWHFILFWEMDSFSATLPFLILLGRLFAWLPPYRVFMVWIYKRSDSLLVTILSHVSLVFTVTALVPMSLSGTSLLIWLLSWGLVLWVFVLFLNKKGR